MQPSPEPPPQENQPRSAPPPMVAVTEQPVIGKGRWLIHFLILASYPVLLGLLGAWMQPQAEGPALDPNLAILFAAMTGELIVFGIFFGLAWSFSRANRTQLFLSAPPSLTGTVVRGFLFSVGLRVLLVVFTIGAAVANKMFGGNEASISNLRPNVEHLVDPAILVEKPLYLLTNMTFVSFIMGGLREEIWRVGMLVGMWMIFPKLKLDWKGNLFAVTVIALLFGLGHLPQGWGGVVMTFLIGWGLGIVMVWRKSIWEPVLAHGFFNATTFFLLYLVAKYQPEALSLPAP